MAYTYDDFTSMMKGAGLTESQFSRYDLDLAKSNPNFGIGLISAKKDYMAATTPDARALANADAESIRTKYGNYTGGSTGTSYKPGGPTPSSFKADAAPTYTPKTPSSFTPKAAPTYTPEPAYKNLEVAPTYMPEPAYNNQYSDKQSQLLNDITSYKPFEFNADTNPQMQAYTKQYSREGDRAMQDTLGSAAAATGGMPSTAAVSAAGQANDYYMGQLGDKLPQIYESEYNKYLSDFNMQNQKLTAVNGQEQIDYSRYWDGKNFNWDKYLSEVDQSNNNRDFGYKQYTDNKNFNYDTYLNDLNQSNNNRDFGYQQFTDNKNFDYNAHLNDLNQSNNNRDFSYGQYTDNITNAQNVDNVAYGRTLDAATTKTNAEQTAYNRQLDAASGAAAAKQNEFDNQYKIDTLNADAKTTKFNQMMDKFQSLQYADAEIAGVLGVPEGTPYGGTLTQLAVDQAKANIAQTYKQTANIGKTSGGVGGGTITAAQISDAWGRVIAGTETGADLALLGEAGISDKLISDARSGGGGNTGNIDAVIADVQNSNWTKSNVDALVAGGYSLDVLKADPFSWDGVYTDGTAAPAANGDTSWLDAYDKLSLDKLGMPNITEAQVISIINNPKYASWVGSNGKMFFKLR